MKIDIIDTTFRHLNDSNINYVLLRSLDSLYQSEDIDLLCEQKHIRQLRAILIALGFVELKSPGHKPHIFFILFDFDSGKWIKFDIINQISFGFPYKTYQTHLATEFLATKFNEKDIYVLSKESEFLLLAMHCLLDKKLIENKYNERLLHLYSSSDFEHSKISGYLSQLSVSLSPDLLLQPNNEAREILSQQLSKTSDTSHKIGRFFYTYFRGLLNPKITIALIGPDGVGKSTVISELTNSFPLGIKSVYMGWSDHENTLKLPTSKWLYRRYNKTKTSSIVEKPEFPSEVQALSENIKPHKEQVKVTVQKIHWKQLPGIINEIAEQYTRYFYAKYYKFRGAFVLYDRYVYDQFIFNSTAKKEEVKPQDKILAEFFKRFFPDPDLTILLAGDAELIHQRKNELPAHKIAKRIALYEEIGRTKKNFHIIDVNVALELEIKRITQIIWQEFKNRNS